MSEFNPFSSGTVEEAPQAVSDEAEESAGNRKNVVMVGALAAVVLGAGAFLLFGGGGDDELEEYVPTASAPRAAAPAAAPGVKAKLPVASKVTLGRNPFRALYVAPVAAAAGSGTTVASSGSTPTTTAGVSRPIVIVDSGSGSAPAPAPVSGGTTYTPPAGQPAPAPAAPATQSTVELKGVAAAKEGANPTGTFVYDGKEVTGAPGDVMAGKLLVISLQQDVTGGWFANLQLGDGSPFEVHQRQKVVVQ